MADEQQEKVTEQSNQQADGAAAVNEEGTLHDEEIAPAVVDSTEGTEEAGNTQADRGIDQVGEQAIEQDELTGSDPDGDIMDPVVDHNQTIKEQTDNPDINQASKDEVLPDQDASQENTSPPDKDLNHEQSIQDIPSNQDPADSSPAVKSPIIDSKDSQTNLVEVPSAGDAACESEETDTDQLEDREVDAGLLQPEPDEPGKTVTEGLKLPKEEISTNEQNQSVDNEEPADGTVQSNDNSSNVDPKEAEGAALPSDVPASGDQPNNAESLSYNQEEGIVQSNENDSNVHPKEAEGAALPSDAPESGDQPIDPESPSSNQADQAVTVQTASSPHINNEINQGPTSEINSQTSPESPSQRSPVKEEPSSAESTPVLLQRNNNNELHQGDDFVQLGSVHIPTGGVGDVDEVNEERGSQYDLRDPAMHKMRSSLPVDAYGDSRKHPLPAIHPDPRLSRSLPPSTDPANIPEGYYNRSLSRGEGQYSRTHIPRIPSASGSSKTGTRDRDVRRALNSAKLPPSVMKMSTVMVSARKRAVLNRHSSVFYEERHQTKVISLDEAINSRPPMPFDLDNPGPCRYTPRNKPLNETNAPEFTFGHRLQEKGGGGRTANSKTWFNSKDGFTTKVHWDKRWPSPAHYNSTRPLLGRRKPTMFDYPNFSIGVKSKFSINKRGSENEPGPNEYNRSNSDSIILRKAPSYTISQRHQGTQLWGGKETTPGPGTYTPRWGFDSGMVHHPSFTIQGIRRAKNHQLGPHSTF
ncbi:uncharacterized protein LOC117303511 [Asterias rubens]|uniref:uncharacterized protein LOC117303511 n=1 Tax=Asterias rubens TaxID=7604 RepID=UPI00145588F6|nr:uncharacterized protein LOC117303511 [Asterias rubens]